MKRFWFTPTLISVALFACHSNTTETSGKQIGNDSMTIANAAILTTELLTPEEQAKLKPAEVLERLKAGNLDFTKDNLTVRNNTERIRKASLGQYPKAVILSCLDSRVPVEDVFHSGIGNLFVARVAGNIVNEDILGSLEYGCKVAGAKLILVLGHGSCGAVKSAIDGVTLGNITTLLNKIRPSAKAAAMKFAGDTTSSNPAFVEAVCEENVRSAIREIHQRSPILNEMEAQGKLLIVGGMYDMNTGKVTFLN